MSWVTFKQGIRQLLSLRFGQNEGQDPCQYGRRAEDDDRGLLILPALEFETLLLGKIPAIPRAP